MKSYLLTILFALLCCFTAEAEGVTSISGRVVDDRGRAMARVNVHLEESPIATVTNGDGEFTLKLPHSISKGEVRLSYVGYNTEVVAIEEFMGVESGVESSMESSVEITLHEQIHSIGRVNVDLVDATSYIEEVLKRKHDNYRNDKNYHTAFYREVVKRRNSFATLTEAVVEVEKSGLQSLSSDRAAIYKGRSFKDRRFTDTLFVKFQGGVVSALLLDIAKSHPIVLSEEPQKSYNFWFDKPTAIDGRGMKVVNFKEKWRDSEQMLYHGTLYIDSLTMAIARAEFSLNIEGYHDPISAFIKKKPSGTDVKMLGAKYIVAFRLLDGTWHFDYCNTELNFRCQSHRRLFRNNYTITSEMVVTNHNSEPKKIPYMSNVRSRDFLFESAKDLNDEDFWESYNIIEHEHSIDAVLKRFRRQLAE